jgi:tetratricopeptide (TPR) repeat protein
VIFSYINADTIRLECCPHMRFYCITCILLAVFFSFAAVRGEEAKPQDELFKKAAAYFFKKNFTQAEPLLQRVIDENPENSLAYSYLGDINLVRKRLDDALELYKKSIELTPQLGENYFGLGKIYFKKKHGRMSVEYFRKAIETDTSLKFSYYHMGLAYLMLLRDKNNTIENWETFIKIAPDDPQYNKIKRAITLLKDPNFVIPPPDSDISIEEALLLGGLGIEKVMRKTTDQTEGHELKKTKRKLEELYLDDDL